MKIDWFAVQKFLARLFLFFDDFIFCLGGPRRVVLLLPDGNLMVTEVDEEQFAALEFEK